MKARNAVRLAAVLVICGAMAGGASPAHAGDPGNAYTLFQLTNQDRTSNGLGALAYNASLSSIATSARSGGCGGVNGRSEDLIERNYFSHQIPPCGLYVWQVFNLGSYTAAGENIGWNNYPAAQSVSQINTAFMNSPEHRANILGGYNELGTGAWQATGAWTGAGGSYSNVIMYTEIFINNPGSGGGAPPPPPPPPPPPRYVPPPTGGGGSTAPTAAAPTGADAAQPATADNPPASPDSPPAAPAPSPSIPTCPVPTDIGDADRTSPAPTLPSDGGPAPCPTPNLVGAAPSSGPSVTRVKGSIEAGSSDLLLSDGSGASVGGTVLVPGAGDGGADLVALITAVHGKTATLGKRASLTVKDVDVQLRARAEVRGADREAASRGILETVVDQVLRLFLNV
ncbi:MAG: CAP domain-containing protein [Candidatus Dormibacteria bacterium]